MSKTLGIGFVIGATVAATVNSAFTTVSNKIKQTQADMGKARQEMAALNKAMTLRDKRNTVLAQYKSSGGSDAKLRSQLKAVSAAYARAKSEALKYGAAVADWEARHKKAVATLEAFSGKKKLLSSMQAEKNRRGELRQNLVGDVARVMAVAFFARLPLNEKTIDSD